MPPTPVEVAVVRPQTIVDRLEAVGTVQADQAVTVVTEIDGIVVDLPFREGSEVRRGDLLARLDDAQLKAEVDRATALRDQSRTTFERVKAIVDQRAGSPQDLDDAAAALKVAEADLALAESRWSKTRIRAPFGGVVGSRQVSVGAFVPAGAPVVDLASIRDLRVNFSAPERMLGQLRPDATVLVTSPVFPGVEVTGRILVIDPVVDPMTRNSNIVAVIKNPRDLYRPGMSVNVGLTLREAEQALAVPNEAVLVEGDQAFVYVVGRDSTVARAPLQLGSRQADIVEVIEGIEPGARVVRGGHQKLYPGAKVMPIVSGAPAPGAGPGGPDGSGQAPGGTPPGSDAPDGMQSQSGTPDGTSPGNVAADGTSRGDGAPNATSPEGGAPDSPGGSGGSDH